MLKDGDDAESWVGLSLVRFVGVLVFLVLGCLCGFFCWVCCYCFAVGFSVFGSL